MMEKKPGLFLLEKQRTINLFKADYNWLLGLVSRLRMVYSAEEQHQLSDSQWGRWNNPTYTRQCHMKSLDSHAHRLEHSTTMQKPATIELSWFWLSWFAKNMESLNLHVLWSLLHSLQPSTLSKRDLVSRKALTHQRTHNQLMDQDKEVDSHWHYGS